MKKLFLVLLTYGFWAPSAGAVEDTIPPQAIIDSVQDYLYKLQIEYIAHIQNRQNRREAMEIVTHIQYLLSMLDFGEQPDLLQPKDLSSLLESLRNELLDRQRLKILKTFLIARKPSLTVDQVAEIMDAFLFDRSKVEAVRLMYPYIQDKENGYKLVNKLTFSNEKDELMRIFTSGQ